MTHVAVEAVELDIANPRSIETAASKLIADYPELNVLINNAGIMIPDQVAGAIDEQVLTSTVTTNLLGPIRFYRPPQEPTGDDRCVFGNEGGAPFVRPLPTISPAGKRRPST